MYGMAWYCVALRDISHSTQDSGASCAVIKTVCRVGGSSQCTFAVGLIAGEVIVNISNTGH